MSEADFSRCAMYACGAETEELQHRTPDAAILAFLREVLPPNASDAEVREIVERHCPLRVYGYVPETVDRPTKAWWTRQLADQLRDMVDDECGRAVEVPEHVVAVLRAAVEVYVGEAPTWWHRHAAVRMYSAAEVAAIRKGRERVCSAYEEEADGGA
jgi:hypothetical protein